MTDEEREDLNTFKHELVKQIRWWKWKAEMLEKETEQLKSENAALRERLGKAVELPRIVHGTRVEYINYLNEIAFEEYQTGIAAEVRLSELIAAEARLAELKGEKK